MSLIYRLPGRTERITYLGRTEAAQCSAHRVTKSEFGLDSMSVDWKVAAPFLAGFMQTLEQGKRLDHNGRKWFLTQWGPDDNNIWPIVTLSCVGLAEGRLPTPKADDSYITQTLSVSATITEDNVPDLSDPPVLTDDVEVSVTREITYRCLETSWEYITEGRPTAPKMGRPSRQQNPGILSSVIIAEDSIRGTRRFSGATADAAYVTATVPATIDFVLDLNAVEIKGTPYFHVTEVVSRMFIAA